jgi:integrase
MTAFAKADISTVMRDWMVLCLTTGLRRQESMTLSWEQVDLEQKRIVLPTNKSDRFLIVPMIGLTYDLFQSRFESEEKDDTYVFTTKRGTPIKDARKALARVCKDAGIAAYSHHDFRRLFASVCHELGISESEIGGLLNHSHKTVTPVYINQSLNHARSIYQRVVDALDRTIKLEAPETSQNDQVASATDFMRCVFYGKVPLSPDYLLPGEMAMSEADVEREYWGD